MLLIHCKILPCFESAHVSCSDVNKGQTERFMSFFPSLMYVRGCLLH